MHTRVGPPRSSIMSSSKIETIHATYDVVTPLFCGGAYSKSVELRLPSFKGGLRFWWRALAWSRFGGDLKRIKQAEDELFGSAEGGQARVRMRLTCKSLGKEMAVRKVIKLGAGARYLGYGLMVAFDTRANPSKRRAEQKAGQLLRACLEEPTSFTLSMRCRGLGEEREHLRRALRAYGMFGGMGARSRRGYGSLVLRSLEMDPGGVEPKYSPLPPESEIRALVQGLEKGPEPAEYTAITAGARVIVVEGADNEDTRALLDRVGREMVRFRSWGRNGMILNDMESERNFREDHDLMKMSAPSRRVHPKRIAFGLPHNYARPDGRLDRRASPLFIHMHQFKGRSYAILTLLPSRFLPDGVGIWVGDKVVQCEPDEKIYTPIHDFLNRMLDSERWRERSNEVKVQP